MADDISVRTSSNPAAPKVATDDIGGRHYQEIKAGWGADNVWSQTADAPGSRFPINLAESALLPGSLNPLGALKTGAAEGSAVLTVAIGANLSSELDARGLRNLGIIIPAEFDGTSIMFQISRTSGGTYYPLYDIYNTRVQMTVAAARAYDLPGELTFASFLKVECVTPQATTVTSLVVLYRS